MPSDMSLHDLHEVLQVLYGWANYHLYSFTLEHRYEKLRCDLDQRGAYSATAAGLDELLSEGVEFVYNYDFGDNWLVDLKVEKIESNPRIDSAVCCLEGENAGPPEDVGGPTGYEDFLRIIKDPDAFDHEHLKKWIQSDFQRPFGRTHTFYGRELAPPPEKETSDLPWNPEAFNIERINRDLLEINWFKQKELLEGSRDYELVGLRIPKDLKKTVLKLFRRTDRFCGQYLAGDPEYARLFRRAVVKLARKRPSPLQEGRLNDWIGGIIWAIGSINCLFDSREKIHISRAEICLQLDVPVNVLEKKAHYLELTLKIDPFEAEWLRKDLIQRSSYFWQVEVGGKTVNAQYQPPEVYDRFREEGLIPDISRDRFPRKDII